MQLDKVTRLEVIDHSGLSPQQIGRVYTNWNKDLFVSADLQDGGRTLKIFLDKRPEVSSD